jgi:hypothetical protein
MRSPSLATSLAVPPSRNVWVPLSLISAAAGALLALAIHPLLGRDLTMAALTLPVIIPTAAAKTATGCGMNVLMSLPDFRRPVVWRMGTASAYAGSVLLTSVASVRHRRLAVTASVVVAALVSVANAGLHNSSQRWLTSRPLPRPS